MFQIFPNLIFTMCIFSLFFALQITLLTGESGEPLSLHMLLMYSDVVVMTPQILENHLMKDLLPHLGVFTMLIFDECHHTRKKDPYHVLMTSYLKMKDKIQRARQARAGQDAGHDEAIKYKLPQASGSQNRFYILPLHLFISKNTVISYV